MPDSNRGRNADTPARIPPPGWLDVGRRVLHEIGEDRVLLVAGGVTFYMLLALVPTLSAIVSLYGLFSDPATVQQHVGRLEAVVPSGGIDIIQEQLGRLVTSHDSTLGWTFALSLALALWSTNNGMKAVIQALNVAYGEREKRSFVRLTAVSMLMTLCAIALFLVLLAAVIVVPVIADFLGIVPPIAYAVQAAGIVGALLLGVLALSGLYRWGPSREAARWTWISAGSVIALIVAGVTSALFSWYVANFGSYNETYGSLGAIIGFMTWLWIMNAVVILGAELNAELEHQTARDSTTGPERPIGQRGARMADTVADESSSSPEPDPTSADAARGASPLAGSRQHPA